MKNLLNTILFISLCAFLFACSKNDEKSDSFKNLVDIVWVSDSLLLDGENASGPGELLEFFEGEASFNEDGTGKFGQYTGGWYFTNSEQDITITSDELQLPLTCNIIELTKMSFKITTNFTDPLMIDHVVRITFKAK